MIDNPGYLETTSEVDAKLDKHGKTAKVLIIHVGSSSSGVGVSGVASFTFWKESNGKWMFVKMVDIRGMGS